MGIMHGREAVKCRSWWARLDRMLFPYFQIAWLMIGLISLYDMYLVWRHRAVILTVERNPICEWLIRWDPDGLSYFLCAKSLGTLFVLSALLLLFMQWRRIAMSVVSGVAAFQLALLLYLSLATR